LASLRQRSLKWRTVSQQRSHALRHVIGLRHVSQILLGRCAFATVLPRASRIAEKNARVPAAAAAAAEGAEASRAGRGAAEASELLV
jgi:hypothetical protein